MADLNFPDPLTSPWVDPNGITWEHDGDGWISELAAVSKDGILLAQIDTLEKTIITMGKTISTLVLEVQALKDE